MSANVTVKKIVWKFCPIILLNYFVNILYIILLDCLFVCFLFDESIVIVSVPKKKVAFENMPKQTHE